MRAAQEGEDLPLDWFFADTTGVPLVRVGSHRVDEAIGSHGDLENICSSGGGNLAACTTRLQYLEVMCNLANRVLDAATLVCGTKQQALGAQYANELHRSIRLLK
jgi:hypothetical protein